MKRSYFHQLKRNISNLETVPDFDLGFKADAPECKKIPNFFVFSTAYDDTDECGLTLLGDYQTNYQPMSEKYLEGGVM